MRVSKQAKIRYEFNRIRHVKAFADAMLDAEAKLATNPLDSSARGMYKALKLFTDKYYPYTIKKLCK